MVYWRDVLQFMQEISASWQMTVDSRLGLFAHDAPLTSPLVYSQTESPTPSPPSVLPHHIWTRVISLCSNIHMLVSGVVNMFPGRQPAQLFGKHGYNFPCYLPYTTWNGSGKRDFLWLDEWLFISEYDIPYMKLCPSTWWYSYPGRVNSE